MLAIISDLHLGDGTTATSIPARAFYLFASRLCQDARFASMQNGTYRPIEFDPSNDRGTRETSSVEKILLRVRLHYMVGNPDRYHHLKGKAFDPIRAEIIRIMGLSKPHEHDDRNFETWSGAYA